MDSEQRDSTFLFEQPRQTSSSLLLQDIASKESSAPADSEVTSIINTLENS